MSNKITNIAAGSAPLDVDDSARQSTPTAVLEGIAARAVNHIVKRSSQAGEPVFLPMPEILIGEGKRGGQTMVCGKTDRRELVHRVFAGSRKGHNGAVWTIQVSPFLARDADACIRELLRAVCVGANMIAKGRKKATNFTRRGRVYVECMGYLGLDLADASEDFNGQRGGAVFFKLSARTAKSFSAATEKYRKLNVNGEDLRPAASGEDTANAKSFDQKISFQSEEQLHAYWAFLSEMSGEVVDSKSKAATIGAVVLARMVEASAEVAPLAVVNG